MTVTCPIFNKMTLRNKTLIIISVTLVGLVMLLYFIAQTILLKSFATLEAEDVNQNVERAATALHEQLVILDTTAGDWAPWDDTYNFVQGKNEAFIEENLMDATLTNLRLNFMLFFDSAHQLVFAKAVDLQSETAVAVPPNLLDYLAQHETILNRTTPQDNLMGVMSLPEAPLLFVSRPILTSNEEGPVEGTLLIGRYLDAAEIEKLANSTRLSLSIRHLDDPHLPPDFQTAQAALTPNQSIFSYPLSRTQIAGYTQIDDAFGQPVLLLKVSLPRLIYQQGQTSLFYFILSVIASGLTFGLVTVLLLEKGVLLRLTHLTQNVNQIAQTRNSAGRVKVIGNDELANLAHNINQMLATVQESETALYEAQRLLEARVEERTAELSEANRLLKQEIAERQQAEDALRQSEQRFRHLVSSISDHIYVTEITQDGQHNNIYLSHQIETLTGYPVETFANDWRFWPTSLIHPEDQAATAEQSRRLAAGENGQIEYRLIRADGEIIWVRDSARIERDPLRQSIFIYGVVSNISERKQAEAQLALAHQTALQASLFKSQLVANVSHDLRTPLNVILSYGEMLQLGVYGPLSERQNDPTQKIIDNAIHLNEMVNVLLDQAQLEAGTLKLTITSFDPATLINQAHATMSVLAETKGLQLITEIAPDMPPTLRGDTLRLQQIIANLLSNGIKFTEQGWVKLQIFQPDATHWAIGVSDSGPGIPVEAQPHLFDAFWQLDGLAPRHYTGFGLGLSIVKQLVTLMGGQISLESKPDQGSTFTISFSLISEREAVA
ncbi:MAG: PAS domain-containing protein [Anaerolineaceae bacterium]|nr:PAS domain-containing protein [Anaerolineaceae bacterium]